MPVHTILESGHSHSTFDETHIVKVRLPLHSVEDEGNEVTLNSGTIVSQVSVPLHTTLESGHSVISKQDTIITRVRFPMYEVEESHSAVSVSSYHPYTEHTVHNANVAIDHGVVERRYEGTVVVNDYH